MTQYLAHYGVKGMKWGKRKKWTPLGGLTRLAKADAGGFYPRPEDPRAHRQNLAAMEYDRYIDQLLKKYGVQGNQSVTARNQLTRENMRIGFELGTKISKEDLKKMQDMAPLGQAARYQRFLDEMAKGKPLNLNNKDLEDASKEYLSSPKAKSDAALADEILRKHEAEWNKKNRK